MAIFFTPITQIYYGCRSDKTIAKKYDLDLKEDKKLINKIRNEQLMWSLAGLLPLIGGAVAWIVAGNSDASEIGIPKEDNN